MAGYYHWFSWGKGAVIHFKNSAIPCLVTEDFMGHKGITILHTGEYIPSKQILGHFGTHEAQKITDNPEIYYSNI